MLCISSVMSIVKTRHYNFSTGEVNRFIKQLRESVLQERYKIAKSDIDDPRILFRGMLVPILEEGCDSNKIKKEKILECVGDNFSWINLADTFMLRVLRGNDAAKELREFICDPFLLLAERKNLDGDDGEAIVALLRQMAKTKIKYNIGIDSVKPQQFINTIQKDFVATVSTCLSEDDLFVFKRLPARAFLMGACKYLDQEMLYLIQSRSKLPVFTALDNLAAVVAPDGGNEGFNAADIRQLAQAPEGAGGHSPKERAEFGLPKRSPS